MVNRLNYNKAFTIVELLIVIVVIAILASITVVAYNGIQQRAKNVKIESNVTTFVKALSIYELDYGNYAMPGTGVLGYCLGETSTFPSGCSHGNPNATFASELKKEISPLPTIENDCLSYMGSCRYNYVLTRQTPWTVDGNSHLYYIIYYLYGNTTCSLPRSLEGSWGAFSTTKTKGYFERSSGNTMCVIEMDD